VGHTFGFLPTLGVPRWDHRWWSSFTLTPPHTCCPTSLSFLHCSLALGSPLCTAHPTLLTSHLYSPLPPACLPPACTYTLSPASLLTAPSLTLLSHSHSHPLSLHCTIGSFCLHCLFSYLPATCLSFLLRLHLTGFSAISPHTCTTHHHHYCTPLGRVLHRFSPPHHCTHLTPACHLHHLHTTTPACTAPSHCTGFCLCTCLTPAPLPTLHTCTATVFHHHLLCLPYRFHHTHLEGPPFHLPPPGSFPTPPPTGWFTPCTCTGWIVGFSPATAHTLPAPPAPTLHYWVSGHLLHLPPLPLLHPACLLPAWVLPPLPPHFPLPPTPVDHHHLGLGFHLHLPPHGWGFHVHTTTHFAHHHHHHHHHLHTPLGGLDTGWDHGGPHLHRAYHHTWRRRPATCTPPAPAHHRFYTTHLHLHTAPHHTYLLPTPATPLPALHTHSSLHCTYHTATLHLTACTHYLPHCTILHLHFLSHCTWFSLVFSSHYCILFSPLTLTLLSSWVLHYPLSLDCHTSLPACTLHHSCTCHCTACCTCSHCLSSSLGFSLPALHCTLCTHCLLLLFLHSLHILLHTFCLTAYCTCYLPFSLLHCTPAYTLHLTFCSLWDCTAPALHSPATTALTAHLGSCMGFLPAPGWFCTAPHLHTALGPTPLHHTTSHHTHTCTHLHTTHHTAHLHHHCTTYLPHLWMGSYYTTCTSTPHCTALPHCTLHCTSATPLHHTCLPAPSTPGSHLPAHLHHLLWFSHSFLLGAWTTLHTGLDWGCTPGLPGFTTCLLCLHCTAWVLHCHLHHTCTYLLCTLFPCLPCCTTHHTTLGCTASALHTSLTPPLSFAHTHTSLTHYLSPAAHCLHPHRFTPHTAHCTASHHTTSPTRSHHHLLHCTTTFFFLVSQVFTPPAARSFTTAPPAAHHLPTTFTHGYSYHVGFWLPGFHLWISSCSFTAPPACTCHHYTSHHHVHTTLVPHTPAWISPHHLHVSHTG